MIFLLLVLVCVFVCVCGGGGGGVVEDGEEGGGREGPALNCTGLGFSSIKWRLGGRDELF